MASSKSLRTIDISSIIKRSSDAIILRFSLLKSNLLSTLAPGTKGAKGSWKKEWMVMPPALMAATPVGATTMLRLLLRSTTILRNVVFPVPALPVKKILRPVYSTKSHAVSSSLFRSIAITVCFAKLRIILRKPSRTQEKIYDDDKTADCQSLYYK